MSLATSGITPIAFKSWCAAYCSTGSMPCKQMEMPCSVRMCSVCIPTSPLTVGELAQVSVCHITPTPGKFMCPRKPPTMLLSSLSMCYKINEKFDRRV